MFCAKCGSQNSDQATFCYKCGAPLGAQAQPAGAGTAGGSAAVRSAPGRSAAASGNAMGSSEGLYGALCGLIRSPLYLAATIAMTAQVVAGILAVSAGASSYTTLIYTMLNNSELAYYMDANQIYALLNLMSRSSILGAVLGNIPVIVILAGLWVLYVEAGNTTKRMSTTGFTMIKVIQIIYMISTILGLAVGAILIFVGLIGFKDYIDNVGVIVVFVILIFGAIGTLSTMFYLKVIKMIGSGQSIILTGNKTVPAYLYVMVLTFVYAGFQAISALGSLSSSGFFGFLANAAAATAGFCFGMVMNKFNTLDAITTAPRHMNAANGANRAENQRPPYPGSTSNNGFGSNANNNFSGNAGNNFGGNAGNNFGGNAGNNFSGNAGNNFGGNRNSNPNSVSNSNPVNVPFNVPKPDTVVMDVYGANEIKKKYAEEGTVVLNEDYDLPPARLVRARDQKEIRITKEEFTIGKAMGSVDGFIEDNPAISRQHAQIVFKDGHYYIIDTNSTNHVFVNGKMIPPQTPVMLTGNMKVRLADEVFDFLTDF